MFYGGSRKGKGLHSYLEVGKTYIVTSLWWPACFFVQWSVSLSISNQTLPGCTGTQKQQDPDAAAPQDLWERSLFGRGISFHDSVSAVPPESQGWEVGGKEIWESMAVLVGASLVAPQGGASGRARVLSPTWPIPITLREKWWGATLLFCPCDPSD